MIIAPAVRANTSRRTAAGLPIIVSFSRRQQSVMLLLDAADLQEQSPATEGQQYPAEHEKNNLPQRHHLTSNFIM